MLTKKTKTMSRKVVVTITVAVGVLGSASLLHLILLPSEIQGEPLRIILKDTLFDMKWLGLEPTVIEILLQRDDGNWVTIWEGSKTLFLAPEAPGQLLAEVDALAGVYIGSRVRLSSATRHYDFNNDNDSDDAGYRLKGIGVVAPELDEKITDNIEEYYQIFEEYGLEAPEPHLLNETWTDTWPWPLRGGEDEEGILLSQGYFSVDWPRAWDYDGLGGEIIYDFTLGDYWVIESLRISAVFEW